MNYLAILIVRTVGITLKESESESGKELRKESGKESGKESRDRESNSDSGGFQAPNFR